MFVHFPLLSHFPEIHCVFVVHVLPEGNLGVGLQQTIAPPALVMFPHNFIDSLYSGPVVAPGYKLSPVLHKLDLQVPPAKAQVCVETDLFTQVGHDGSFAVLPYIQTWVDGQV
jgi:hypothetical protein